MRSRAYRPMIIKVASTPETVVQNGIKYRVWKGINCADNSSIMILAPDWIEVNNPQGLLNLYKKLEGTKEK